MTTTDVAGEQRTDFRRYLWAGGTSTFGTMFTGVAASALAVDLFHVTGFQAGLLRTAGTLPALFITPFAGALADRMPRPRRTLIAAELIAAIAVGLFALGLAVGVTSFALLMVLTTMLGATTAIAASAFFTHLNSLQPDRLPVARAQMQTTDSVVGLGASTVAGPLIAAFGPVVALVTDALSYLLSAGWLRSIAAPDRNAALDASRPPTTIRQDIVEGVRILLGGRLRPVAVYLLVAQSAFTGMAALKAIYVLRTLDIPLYLYGVPGLAAAGFGILGAYLATRIVSAGWDPGRATVAWWAGSAVALLCLPAAAGPLPAKVLVVSLSLGAVSLFGTAGNITLVALFSKAVPERAMGRVNGSLMALSTIATVIGAPTAGVLADRIGVRAAILVCGVIGSVALPILRPWWRTDQWGPDEDQR